jgi:predicted N-formylglutamate amidohydrolase
MVEFRQDEIATAPDAEMAAERLATAFRQVEPAAVRLCNNI